MLEQYRIYFTDMLNQRVMGGAYLSFAVAILTARGITANGFKSGFQIVRISDNVVLAESKVSR